jgi:hypothetical protein
MDCGEQVARTFDANRTTGFPQVRLGQSGPASPETE